MKLTGIYHATVHQSDDCRIRFLFRPSDRLPECDPEGLIHAQGALPAYPSGMPLLLEGTWETSASSESPFFSVQEAAEHAWSKDSLCLLFCSPLFPELSEAAAERLSCGLEPDLFPALSSPELLGKLNALLPPESEIRGDEILERLRELVAFRKLLAFLQPYPVDGAVIRAIQENLRSYSDTILRGNPYLGTRYGMPFPLCDRIALDSGIHAASDLRFGAIFRYHLLQVTQASGPNDALFALYRLSEQYLEASLSAFSETEETAPDLIRLLFCEYFLRFRDVWGECLLKNRELWSPSETGAPADPDKAGASVRTFRPGITPPLSYDETANVTLTPLLPPQTYVPGTASLPTADAVVTPQKTPEIQAADAVVAPQKAPEIQAEEPFETRPTVSESNAEDTSAQTAAPIPEQPAASPALPSAADPVPKPETRPEMPVSVSSSASQPEPSLEAPGLAVPAAGSEALQSDVSSDAVQTAPSQPEASAVSAAERPRPVAPSSASDTEQDSIPSASAVSVREETSALEPSGPAPRRESSAPRRAPSAPRREPSRMRLESRPVQARDTLSETSSAVSSGASFPLFAPCTFFPPVSDAFAERLLTPPEQEDTGAYADHAFSRDDILAFLYVRCIGVSEDRYVFQSTFEHRFTVPASEFPLSYVPTIGQWLWCVYGTSAPDTSPAYSFLRATDYPMGFEAQCFFQFYPLDAQLLLPVFRVSEHFVEVNATPHFRVSIPVHPFSEPVRNGDVLLFSLYDKLAEPQTDRPDRTRYVFTLKPQPRTALDYFYSELPYHAFPDHIEPRQIPLRILNALKENRNEHPKLQALQQAIGAQIRPSTFSAFIDPVYQQEKRLGRVIVSRRGDSIFADFHSGLKDTNGVPIKVGLKKDSERDSFVVNLIGSLSPAKEMETVIDIPVWRRVTDELALLAQPENWDLASDRSGQKQILKSYLQFTYYKAWLDGLLEISPYGLLFDTGLKDASQTPIYCFCRDNHKFHIVSNRAWSFAFFACRGKDRNGKLLNQYFSVFPSVPRYLDGSNYHQLYFDIEKNLDCDYIHIIQDNYPRIPIEFVFQMLPEHDRHLQQMKRQRQMLDDPQTIRNLDEQIWSYALRNTQEYLPALERGFRYAVEAAVTQCQDNYRRIVPVYYARTNSLSLLLPLSLPGTPRAVDVALVISRTDQDHYQGETIYTLEMAYKDARQICRPESDWLNADLL